MSSIREQLLRGEEQIHQKLEKQLAMVVISCLAMLFPNRQRMKRLRQCRQREIQLVLLFTNRRRHPLTFPLPHWSSSFPTPLVWWSLVEKIDNRRHGRKELKDKEGGRGICTKRN